MGPKGSTALLGAGRRGRKCKASPGFVTCCGACDGSLYVGMTNDVVARVKKHRLGLGPEFTKRRRAVELIWSQEFSDRLAARQREVELKGWSRKKKLSLIVGPGKSGGNA